MDEWIQAYLDQIYANYAKEIQSSLLFYQNQHYGELYYYSFKILLSYLDLDHNDRFLDIGSGLGKIMFQAFIITQVDAVYGVEINQHRYQISRQIEQHIRQDLPDIFTADRILEVIHGDFLHYTFPDITVVYVCSTVFSFELLTAIGKQLNSMRRVKKIATFRQIPHLADFKIINKIFLHADWEKVPCYIYERTIHDR